MRPFDAMRGVHKLDFLLLTFLALAHMILYVGERPRTACGAESWVLHRGCGLKVSGGEYTVLHEHKRKQDEPPLVEGFVRVRVGTGDVKIKKCRGKSKRKIE